MPFKILFFIAGFALWVRSIVDIIESEFEGSNMKLVMAAGSTAHARTRHHLIHEQGRQNQDAACQSARG